MMFFLLTIRAIYDTIYRKKDILSGGHTCVFHGVVVRALAQPFGEERK